MAAALPPPVSTSTGAGTRSLDRGISLAKIVAFAPRALSFSEIAEAARVPKSTAFRLLGALQRGGLVERDTDGRYHAGWLLLGIRQPGTTALRRHLAGDAEFLAFLSERLTEEIISATHRRMSGGAAGDGPDPGLQLLDELVRTLRRGELPDDTTLQLLTTAYCEHPDFRTEWRRPGEYAARLARRRG
jgi:DNA-binding MarR family transcriptional regulator